MGWASGPHLRVMVGFPVMLWIAVPAVAVLMLGVLAKVAVDRAYATPRVPASRTPAGLGLRYEDLRIPTVRGKWLHGWWIPAARPAGAPGLVLMHGWSRNVERMLPFLEPLHGMGFNLLAVDARCHGESDEDGHANMLKFSEDIRAAVDALAVTGGTDPGRLGVLGLSVGGAAALHAAAHDPRIRAVVTVGAFAHPGELTAHDLRQRGLPAPLATLVVAYVERQVGVPLDELAPEAHVGRIGVPVLLVHGERDVVVPVEHARRLAAAGGRTVELLLLPERGHSDCNEDPEFWPAVRRVLGKALAVS